MNLDPMGETGRAIRNETRAAAYPEQVALLGDDLTGMNMVAVANAYSYTQTEPTAACKPSVCKVMIVVKQSCWSFPENLLGR